MSVQIERFQAVSWTAVMVAGRGERAPRLPGAEPSAGEAFQRARRGSGRPAALSKGPACSAVGYDLKPSYTALAESWNGTGWAVQSTPTP